MKTLSTTLVLAGAVALSSSALAQAPHFAPVTERVVPTGSTTPTGSGRTFATSGDFSGDHRRDVVMIDLVDDSMDFYYDAGQMSAAFPIADGAKDVSWVRSTPTGHQRFVTTSASGLTLYDVYDAGTFTIEAVAAGSIWNGADRVIACLFDQNNTMDLVGLSNDRQTVIVTVDAFGGSPITNTFTVGAPVTDIGVANWSGSAEKEIVLLFPNGVNVRKKRGANLGGYFFTANAARLTTFSQAGFGYDRVAVVYRDGGSEYLKVLDHANDEAPVLAPDGTYQVEAADVDLDGDDDLLIVSQDVDACRLLFNESDGVAPGTSATFTASSGETVDLYDGATVLNTDQNAIPLFEDFDNDGDPDVALYVADLDALVVQFNSLLDAMANGPMLDTLDPGRVDIDLSVDPESAILTLNFDATTPVGDALDLQLWRVSQATGQTDPQVWHAEYRPIDQSIETFTIELVDENALDPEVDALETNYVVACQTVSENAAGEPIGASSTTLIMFSLVQSEVEDLVGITGTEMELAYEVIDVSGAPMPADPEIEERVIGPGGICVPEVPPTPLPPQPINP